MTIGIDGRYIQDHFPGIGRYTYYLIDALARVAPDEQFIVLHNPAGRNTRYDIGALSRYANIELLQVDVPTFSVREQFQIPGTRFPVPHPRFHIPTGLPRLLHSPYYIKPYWMRIPSVLTFFDLLPLFYPQALPNRRARLLFRWMAALAVRTSDRIIVPSVSTCQDLVGRLHVPRHKIVVTPLAADARFAPQSAGEVRRVSEKYALSSEYVLYVGINKPHKNLSTLLDAWQQVGDRSRVLVIAGAWDERYAQLAVDRGGPTVRYIHNVADADLPGLYAGAAVYVAPSLYEGFGLPPLEAMACGVPVIVSNTSSHSEVVGDAAAPFDPRDARALAAILRELLDDPARREQMRGRSLARAAQFSWERTARETLDVYREVLVV